MLQVIGERSEEMSCRARNVWSTHRATLDVEPARQSDAVFALPMKNVGSTSSSTACDGSKESNRVSEFELSDVGKSSKVTIVFCGREIEINLQASECETLSPEVVKQKWRLLQIAQRNYNSKNEATKSVFKWGPGRLDDLHRGFEYHPGLDSAYFECGDDKPLTATECDMKSTHAVWSGWLDMKVAGMAGLLRRSTRWWSVLSIEDRQLKLLCYSEDAATCAMTMRHSLVLDPASQARREPASMACDARARVSIAERGLGRRRSAACDSPEEADRLVCCINRLLASLDRRASPCSAAV